MPGQPPETLSILYQAHNRWLFTFHHRLDLGWIFKGFLVILVTVSVYLLSFLIKKKACLVYSLLNVGPDTRGAEVLEDHPDSLVLFPENPPRCWRHLKQFAHPQTHIIVRLQVYKIYTRSINLWTVMNCAFIVVALSLCGYGAMCMLHLWMVVQWGSKTPIHLYLLVVSTHLKNISQIGSFPQVGVRIKKYLKQPPSLRVSCLNISQNSGKHISYNLD